MPESPSIVGERRTPAVAIDAHERPRVAARSKDQGPVLCRCEVDGAAVLCAHHAVHDSHRCSAKRQRLAVERHSMQFTLAHADRVIHDVAGWQVLRLRPWSQSMPLSGCQRQRAQFGTHSCGFIQCGEQGLTVGQE